MRATRQLAALYAALFIAASFVWTATAESQASNTEKEHFVATAVDMGNTGGRAVANQIDIVINRWTSDAARDRLVSVLREKAAEGLLKALQKEPVVGRISAPGTLAYDLHYARQMPGEDGGRRIVLGTDRPVGFWEAQSGARTLDYPFTLIELRVDNDGKGEGKLSLATRPTLNDNVLVLEDYAAQPVLLQNVHRFR
jgi:hypothetical protein